MSRTVIGRIINGKYTRMSDATPLPSRGPVYGEGSKDYFRGVTPSQLRTLDNQQLYEAASRIHMTLSERRGTTEELAHASDAYATTVREARSRRATLHD
jgi:hypothetical protein